MSNKLIDKDFPENNKQETFSETQTYEKYEKDLLIKIEFAQEEAETTRISTHDDYGNLIERGLETLWEDENKIYIGNHWETSVAYRSWKEKKKRPNSVNNLVFNAIQNIHANIVSSTPTMDVEPVDDEELEQKRQEDMQENVQSGMEIQPSIREFENAQTKPFNHDYTKKDIADKLTCITKFNNKRNKFNAMWKNIVLEFIKHGPAIVMVIWNDEWIGGRGPKKWVGDVELIHVKKEEFYPDPAIVDLDYRMQECSYINRKFRKKIQYIKDRWENGKYVCEEDNERDQYQDEGINHGQAWLIEHWHRGKPKFMPSERKEELLKLSEKYKELDKYKSDDYKAMANGTMDGIHLAYISNGIFLEYIPYIYDHGKYPFVFKTRYKDQNNPYGFGEIRQLIIPQILFNKADEMEIEAFSRQGGGQEFVRKGSVSPSQMDNIISNSGKGGMMFVVDDPNGITPRQPVTGNPALTNFKHHKQEMIDEVSGVTDSMKGKAEFSNMPARLSEGLQNRAIVKMNPAIDILEDLLIEICELRIELFAQFYEDDRYYTIKGEQGTKAGKFNREMMMFTFTRNGEDEVFIPEFETTVRIMDEKPTDRNTIMQEAFALFDRQMYQAKHVLYALEETKLPQREAVEQDIQASIQAQQQAQQAQVQAEAQKLQHDMKMAEEKMNIEKQKLAIEAKDKQNQYQLEIAKLNMDKVNQDRDYSMRENESGENNQNEIDQFLAMLEQEYPEFYQSLMNMPEEKMIEIVQQAMNIPVEELSIVLPKLLQLAKENTIEGGNENEQESNTKRTES